MISKQLFSLLTIMVFSLSIAAQNISTETESATSKLPKGTYFKDNKIFIKKGYTATKIKGTEIVVVRLAQNGGATAAFKCKCSSGSGTCGVTILDNSMLCTSAKCERCDIDISTSVNTLSILESGQSEPNDIKWKHFTAPVIKNMLQKQ